METIHINATNATALKEIIDALPENRRPVLYVGSLEIKNFVTFNIYTSVTGVILGFKFYDARKKMVHECTVDSYVTGQEVSLCCEKGTRKRVYARTNELTKSKYVPLTIALPTLP